ncbi:hypothetical protein O3P69_000652 [Scylla paramamosain]|uniref:Secreted protein n=1 Tax=Scylla paramamosain TaxID=85552 RepID=A0AAW0UVM8_SCYPA
MLFFLALYRSPAKTVPNWCVCASQEARRAVLSQATFAAHRKVGIRSNTLELPWFKDKRTPFSLHSIRQKKLLQP